MADRVRGATLCDSDKDRNGSKQDERGLEEDEFLLTENQ